MQMVQDCPHCGEESRCRRREFSEQTWSVLSAWGEVENASVDQPICDSCYNDLREILIDRADEISVALVQPTQPGSSVAAKKTTAKKAATAAAPEKAKKPAGRSKKTSKVA